MFPFFHYDLCLEGYERLVRAKEASPKSSENFDMFGEDDEENDVNAQLDASVVDSGSGSEQLPKLTSENSDPSQELHSGSKLLTILHFSLL